MRTAATLALAIIGIGGGSGTARELESSAPPDCAPAERQTGEPSGSPLEYLRFLQGRATCPQAIDRHVYTIWSRRHGWVREEDLAGLFERVDSKAPCPHTVSALSSWAPLRPSFVGQEAVFLIASFREGVFPPSLHSDGYYRRRGEMLKWWTERHKSRPAS